MSEKLYVLTVHPKNPATFLGRADKLLKEIDSDLSSNYFEKDGEEFYFYGNKNLLEKINNRFSDSKLVEMASIEILEGITLE